MRIDRSTPQQHVEFRRPEYKLPRPEDGRSETRDRQRRRSSNPVSETASPIADATSAFPAVLPLPAVPLPPQSGGAVLERPTAGEGLSLGTPSVSTTTVMPPAVDGSECAARCHVPFHESRLLLRPRPSPASRHPSGSIFVTSYVSATFGPCHDLSSQLARACGYSGSSASARRVRSRQPELPLCHRRLRYPPAMSCRGLSKR